MFFISILFPEIYPFKPLKFYFLTPIYHPNIGEDGEVLIDLFSTLWSPIWELEASGFPRQPTKAHLRLLSNIYTVMQAVISILHSPDWDSNCRQDVSLIYSQDPVGFNAVSRVHTQRYAHRSEPPEKLFQQYEREILDSFVQQQISQVTSSAATTWLQLTADDPEIAKVVRPWY